MSKEVGVSFVKGRDELDPEKLAELLERLRVDRPRALDRMRDDTLGFHERFLTRYAEGIDLLRLVHHQSIDAAMWGKKKVYGAHEESPSDDDGAALALYGVTEGLAARAMLTFAETVCLLAGGFPRGAMTRVRTMHELVVTALILGIHGAPDGEHPELVQRYLRHHEAFTRRVAEQMLAAQTDVDDILDDALMQALRERRQQLVDEFGPRFVRPLGWAAPLFSQDENLTFERLAAKVDAQTLNYFYGKSSTYVHAGSEGWHDAFVQWDGAAVMLAGPTNLGLTTPAHLATHFLMTMLHLVVPTQLEQDGVVDDAGAYYLAYIGKLAEDAVNLISAAEDVVEAAERDLNAEAG